MWVDETIFSLGDLSYGLFCDKYVNFIDSEYQGNFTDRLNHVSLMIQRLEEEKRMLELMSIDEKG